MKKTLKKREIRGQKNLQLYACSCPCSCGGCGSTVRDSENVHGNSYSRTYESKAYHM